MAGINKKYQPREYLTAYPIITAMFILKFKTDTAAFDLYPANEVAAILANVQKQIEYYGETDGTVRDVNGNTIGEWELNDD